MSWKFLYGKGDIDTIDKIYVKIIIIRTMYFSALVGVYFLGQGFALFCSFLDSSLLY